jgi:hypothetical protein
MSIIQTSKIQTLSGQTFQGVLQVQQFFFADTTTVASSSFVDSPLVVSITPYYSTSKILVMANVQITMYTLTIQTRFTRNNSAIAVGNASSSRTQTSNGWLFPSGDGNHQSCPTTMMFLDSPATSGTLVYRVQYKTQSGNTAYLNRSVNDADNGDWSHRSTSSITVMEMAQ